MRHFWMSFPDRADDPWIDQLRQRRPDLITEIDSITGVLGSEGSSYATVLQAITQEWVNGHLIDPRWMSGPDYIVRLKKDLTRFCPVRVDTFW